MRTGILDAARNRLVARFQARPMSITERSEYGITLRWKPAKRIPGRVPTDLSATIRYETWVRELYRRAA